MSNYSTVPAVRAALRQLIANKMPTLKVFYGYPPEIDKTRECIYIARTEGTHTVPVLTAGRKRGEEDYKITVVAEVIWDRGTAEAADARCWELMGAVRDVIANDPSLGNVDGLIHAVLDGEVRTEVGWNTGPIARIEAEVSCLSRLT